MYYIYDQINAKNIDFSKVIKENTNWVSLLFVFVILALQFVNYGLENLKWRTTLVELKRFPFLKTQKAIYAGNAIAIFTPDRLGTFAGRLAYLNEVSKTKVTFSTFIGNYAQLVSTTLFALVGCALAWNLDFNFQFPKQLPLNLLILILIPITVIGISILFHQRLLFHFLSKIKSEKIKKTTEKIQFSKDLNYLRIGEILLYAILRYLIFTLQFYFAIILFGVEIDWLFVLSFCGVLYLFSTIIPSPFLGNLGTREAIAIFLLANSILVDFIIGASLLIWLINIVFPAVLGGIILLNKK